MILWFCNSLHSNCICAWSLQRILYGQGGGMQPHAHRLSNPGVTLEIKGCILFLLRLNTEFWNSLTLWHLVTLNDCMNWIPPFHDTTCKATFHPCVWNTGQKTGIYPEKAKWSSTSAAKCFTFLTFPYNVKKLQKHFKYILSWVERATFDNNTEYCPGALEVLYQEWEYCPFVTEKNPKFWVSKWSALEHMQGNGKTEILLKTVSWDMLIHPAPSSHSEISTNFLSAFVGKRRQ